MFKIILSIFVFLPLCLCQRVWADEALSLKEALFLAYEGNPDIRQKREEVEASKGRFITQVLPEGPEATFEIGGFKSEEVKGEEVDPERNLDSFEIIQSFDLPPVWFLKSGAAYDEIKISEGEFLSTWASVRSEVKSSFSGILYTNEALRVQNSNLEASRQFLDRVEVKYQSGNASKSDHIRAKIEVLKAQSEFLEAENEAKSAKARLNLLLGRPSETTFSIEGALTYEAVELRKEELRNKALKERPDLLNQRIRLRKSSKETQKAVFEFFPKPFVGFNRTDEDFEDDYSVILGAKFTSWDLNIGAIKEKAAEEAKERIRLEAFEREVTNEIEIQVRQLENLKRKVEINKKAIDEANELLREVTLQYEEGDVNFLIYLENLKTIKEARLSYFKALKDYAEALSTLERMTQKAEVPEGAKR